MSTLHVAVIMDGNGRWAKLRGRERTFGHIKGARTAKSIIEHAARSGVTHLTLYAFSTENWLRPFQEVQFLMKLLGRNLKRERKNLMRNNIQFHAIGDWSRVPDAVSNEIKKSITETAANTGMKLSFAIGYGGRLELTQAFQAIGKSIELGELKSSDINEELIEQYLQTYNRPDPDLIIRTSGESRLSNFLIWQSAYSEIYITEQLWPDFNEDSFDQAVQWLKNRNRRFGKTQEQLDGAPDSTTLKAHK